jgi:hypothetical protein
MLIPAVSGFGVASHGLPFDTVFSTYYVYLGPIIELSVNLENVWVRDKENRVT